MNFNLEPTVHLSQFQIQNDIYYYSTDVAA